MRIGHEMMDYSRRFKAFIKKELAEEGIGFAEGMTLLTLLGVSGEDECVRLSAEALLRKISYDKSVMTRTLQGLEEAGYVTRARNPKDARSWLFGLTSEGCVRATKVATAVANWSNVAFDKLNDEELELLEKMLSSK